MSTKDIIKNSVLENFTADISLTRVCISLGLAVVLSLYMFYIYRTIESAPTIPSEMTRFDCMASTMAAVITDIRAMDLLNSLE